MFKFSSTIIILLMALLNQNAFANYECFIAKDIATNKILIQDGDKCETKQSPASSFKIAISLIGFNEKILIDENNPSMEYKTEYRKDLNFDPFDTWLEKQTPQSWIKNSCVWYSQVIMKQLGMEKFKNYIKKFNYGNIDLSGDYKKNNGLTHAWLSSSLQISPIEQLVFLEKFLLKKNDVISDEARQYTKNIIYKDSINLNDWKVFGKTGSGNLLNSKHQRDAKLPFGWFIGFVEKDNKQIAFVSYIEQKNETNEQIYIGQDAQKIALENLQKITIKSHK